MLRLLLVAAVAAVGACAQAPQEGERVSVETHPHLYPMAAAPSDEARRALMERARAEGEARRQQDQAEAICAARAEMAGATYSGRGFGLTGAISAGMEAGIAAERVRAACLNAYRRTGVMPSY